MFVLQTGHRQYDKYNEWDLKGIIRQHKHNWDEFWNKNGGFLYFFHYGY